MAVFSVAAYYEDGSRSGSGVPYSKSTGNLAGRPNIRKNVVKPAVGLTPVLYAIQIFWINSFQFSG